MRRQFNWLVLAVTSLLVVAFVVPLGLLVRRQAVERAQVAAEQRAQAAAATLAVALAGSETGLDPTLAERALVADVSILLPDGTVVGTVMVPASLSAAAASGRPASETREDGSWAVALPVATADGMVAVVAMADAEAMTAGVGRASGMLAALGVVLIGGAVLLADRLGRSVVRPVTRLAEVADRIGQGDLAARAGVEGPHEIRSVAIALNRLAARLGGMISGEREALADLSHRLRTPLTSLRLEAERIGGREERERLLTQVDRTQRAIDQLIVDVRSRGEQSRGQTADLVAVARGRLEFWAILAEEQQRPVTLSVPDGPVLVAGEAAEVAAALDALIGNVFSHTPAGTAFALTVEQKSAGPVVTVADEGPGFSADHVRRGASGSGSTGLGLDIAAGLARRLGGGLDVEEGPGGGALVRLRIGGPVSDGPRS